MSPIGRVFIILNLILAATFVGFAGTYLKDQNNFKTQLEEKSQELVAAQDSWNAERLGFQDSLSEAERVKTALDQQLSNAKNDNEDLSARNTQLSAQLASVEGDVKELRSVAESMQQQSKIAFEQAQKAYNLAIEDQKAKDSAVRDKDDAVARLAEATRKIGDLERAGEDKQMQIAALSQDNSELKLLVDVAKLKGFIESMAVPPLAGTVSHVSGRLVTVSVTDNPTSADIKPGYQFAIYEGNTYKGDAIVTEADTASNVAFCRVYNPVRGTSINEGDSARTSLN